MLGIRQWRHGAFCVSRQHRLRRRWPRRILMCLPSVNHEQFPMQMTHKHNKWLQILAQEDFPSKLLWSENADFQLSVNNERRRRQQETVEQKEHRLAQQRQRLQQETEEQEIGIRGIMIVHCRKPIPTDICTSKSAKFQLCFTAQTIIFRRTDICSLFLSFFKSGRRNNAKSAFQYTVNNKTT